MSDVDTLRKAAAQMRERAQAATPGPWSTVSGASNVWRFPEEGSPTVVVGGNHSHGHVALLDAQHIASWHPAVALAVADWLALVAHLLDEGFAANAETGKALAVARAYLGGE
jgi:hypothetical protein